MALSYFFRSLLAWLVICFIWLALLDFLFFFAVSRLHWLFAYRFYAVAKFSLGTAWARVSACLPSCLPAAACCLLMLQIYASCLRLFNQLFSLTRVCLARSRSLFNYSCTALAALSKFVILWVFLNCFSPASSPFISRRHWEFSFAPSLCRCTRLRRLLQDHKWGTKFSCSCVCSSLCLTLCVGVLLCVSVCVCTCYLRRIVWRGEYTRFVYVFII